MLLEIANSRPGELSNEDDEEELRLTMLGILARLTCGNAVVLDASMLHRVE